MVQKRTGKSTTINRPSAWFLIVPPDREGTLSAIFMVKYFVSILFVGVGG